MTTPAVQLKNKIIGLVCESIQEGLSERGAEKVAAESAKKEEKKEATLL